MPADLWLSIPRVTRSFPAIVIASFASLTAFAQTQPPIFPVTKLDPTISVTTSRGTNFATGDFDGDGQQDLAVIGNSTSTTVPIVVLFTPVGSANPVSVTTAPLTCRSINSLAAADINNDHKLDLILNCDNTSIAVLLGNGDRTFQTPTYFAASVQSFTAVDLNGDGYPDIVATTANSDILVFLNHNGLLSPPVLYSNTASVNLAGPPAIGDFNGDGKQDVLLFSPWGTPFVPSYAPNNPPFPFPFGVMYGNGDGTFQPAQKLSLPKNSAPGALIVSDLNNDGIADFAYISTDWTVGNSSTTVQVMLGNSAGTFTTGSSIPLGLLANFYASSPSTASSGGLVSFRRSGSSNTTDLALMGSGTTILTGDGKGGFTIGQTFMLTGQVIPQSDSSGKTNLLVDTSSGAAQLTHTGFAVLPGNGDGTFQGIPALPIQSGYITVDVNGDGLTDLLSLDINRVLVTSLGRGNGTFSNTTPNPALTADVLAAGDFNKDGNLDVVGISAGTPPTYSHGDIPAIDSMLYFYAGNGIGGFQPNANGLDLKVYGVQSAVVGDFNGDGNLDIVVTYYESNGSFGPSGGGSLFLPGKGDGTFGTPVPIAGVGGPLVAADLNRDGKLDLWNGIAFLGNGDGTFTQMPSNFTVQGPAPLADLNGDGILDIIDGAGIHAGNGDGTFQSTPFFTPVGGTGIVSVGDVNADGHPDLLFLHATTTTDPGRVAVYLGDGHGNFTNDTNTYYAGAQTAYSNGIGVARLNNQAPPLPGDNALDLLVSNSGIVSSLLNQLNPAPTPPAALPSKTTLAVSAPGSVPNQQLTFTATVTVLNPTGNVTFTSGSKTLGTVPLTNGTATLTYAFTTVGNYPVTAAYAGDTNNLPSSSSSVSVTIAPAASKTNLAVSSGSANLNQQLNLTATVTGVNPTGNVTFTTATATLGTVAVANGVATLPFAFTAPGTYTVTSNYPGDISNLASTSNTITVVVTAPDYSVSASPASATITAGQSTTTTLTVTPVGGYNGTIKFSCGTLIAGVACAFAPASIIPANNTPATTTLTITTTAATTASLRNGISGSLQGIAWAGLVFLALSPRRMRGSSRRLTRAVLLTFLLAAGLISFSGCSSSSPKAPVTIPGTPAGVQAITVTVADSGATSHSVNFQLTVK